MFGMILIAGPLRLWALDGWTGRAVTQAVRDAGIRDGDSVPTKVQKAGCLLKGGYFNPSAQPKVGDYNLDGQRSAEEVLAEKRGGFCGSYAKSIAAMLVSSGVPKKNIRIVEGMINDTYAQICPKKNAPVKRDIPNMGLGGHVFLLLKLDGRWNLINPMATCEKLVSIPFLSPTEIDSEMKAGPLGIPKEMPMYDSAFNSGLTIFDAWTLDAYPRHGFSDRYNLAASGTLKSPNCRYEARDFRGRGGQNTAPPAAAGR